MLTALLATGLFGCELGPPEDLQEGATVHSDSSYVARCGDTEPTCVVGCGLQPTGQAPTCKDGRWRCDGGVPSDGCTEYNGMVCDIKAPCGFGYTCVQSVTHPIPADAGICRKGEVARDSVLESCDVGGMTGPIDFIEQGEALTGQIVKLTGRLETDLKCSNNACGDDPCCNTCAGNYVIDVTDPNDPSFRRNVTIRSPVLPCLGTTCEVSCGPLAVGDTYMVWGLLDWCKGESCSLLYMGSCPY